MRPSAEGNRTFDRLDQRAVQPAPERFARLRWTLLGVTVLGIGGCIAAYFLTSTAGEGRQFYFSYLTAYLFCLTLPLGLLFFVMLHHVVDAGWSVVLRRAAEQVLAALPVLALLFLPILLGALRGNVFDWISGSGGPPASHVATAAAEALHKKRPYLNVPFFVARAVVYFAVWCLLAWKLRSNSIRQDQDGAARWTFRLRRWSAGGMYLYAFTFTFAIFDWVMSLDYRWFSTVLGVYGWAGSVVGSLALLILIALALGRGPLKGLVSSDHLHDLGKLLFAFCVFWAYIAFSQYFVIWYGNIPEETAWYLKRWAGLADTQSATWWKLSILLPIGHFAVPFLVLLAAAPKRNPRVLTAMATFLLLMHYLDVYWMVQPALNAGGPPFRWLWVDLSALLAIGGLSALLVVRALGRAALYPVRDPRLQESLMAEHVEEVLGADVE